MTLSRRQLGLLAAAAGLAPGPAFAQVFRSAIIAVGGAAESRIEDTRSALDLAIVQGCDFIQVNLVPTKEGALVARRDSELSASTDVAARSQFADRKTTKTIDGRPVEGWFAEDFALTELQALACVEAAPALRPQNQRYDGKEGILALPDVLRLARDGCVKTGRTVGVCLRLRRVSDFQDQGLDVVSALANELSTEGYIAPAAAVWVQASEPEALRGFGRLSRVRRMLMIEAGSPDAARQTTREGLAEIRGVAEAIGADIPLLIDPGAATFPAPTTLALDAHNAGLRVFGQTARPQNAFLPPQLRQGDKRSKTYANQEGDISRLLVGLFADGLDGVGTTRVEDAAQARDAVMAALKRARARGR